MWGYFLSKLKHPSSSDGKLYKALEEDHLIGSGLLTYNAVLEPREVSTSMLLDTQLGLSNSNRQLEVVAGQLCFYKMTAGFNRP